MNGLKKSLLALMAAFMLVGVASGCSNQKETDDTKSNTEQNQDADSQDSGTQESNTNQGTEDKQAE